MARHLEAAAARRRQEIIKSNIIGIMKGSGKACWQQRRKITAISNHLA